MNIHQSESGLLVASTDSMTPPTPPEHPLRPRIREALAMLQFDLAGYEQTTHAVIGQGCEIESVAGSLVRCYENPTPYTISDLHQFIGQLLKADD